MEFTLNHPWVQLCLYHILRSSRRQITCQKNGIAFAERVHCLNVLQLVAFSKSVENYNKNLILLRNTKTNSVTNHFEKKLVQKTINNRLESIFNKIKSVCSKYAGLMQFLQN